MWQTNESDLIKSGTSNKASHRERLESKIGNLEEVTFVSYEKLEKGSGVCACGEKGLKHLYYCKTGSNESIILGSSCIELIGGKLQDESEGVKKLLELIEKANDKRSNTSFQEANGYRAFKTGKTIYVFQSDSMIPFVAEKSQFGNGFVSDHKEIKGLKFFGFTIR